MRLLGPSILMASPPFCTGYAYYACRGARAKYPARAGLVVAAVELLTLVALIVRGLVVTPSS